MVPAGNKAKRLSSVGYSAKKKTIHILGEYLTKFLTYLQRKSFTVLTPFSCEKFT